MFRLGLQLLGEQDSEGEEDDMDAKIEKMMKSSGTRRKQEGMPLGSLM